MRRILSSTLRLIAEHWVLLTAVLLLAWNVHYYGIELSAAIATERPVEGWALLPLAILLFIVGYAIVFRLLRPSLQGFDDDDAPLPAPPPSGGEAPVRPAPLRRVSGLASAVVLPFFVMWSAWGFFDDDLEMFASEVNRRFIFQEGGPDFRPSQVPFGWVVVLALVGAYLARLASERLERRWPAFALGSVYFEVLWVFFFSLAVLAPLRDLVVWVRGTNLWAEITIGWEQLLEAMAPLEAVWEAVVVPVLGVIPVVVETLFLPLAWFALAAIVIGRPLPDAVVRAQFLRRHPALERGLERSGRFWKAAPGPVRGVVDEFTEDLLIRATSLANAFSAMRSLGIERIAGFILIWCLLNLVESSTMLVIRELLGVQDTRFWLQLYNPLMVIAWLPVQVVRVCLVAATYSAALRAAGVTSGRKLPLGAGGNAGAGAS
ncbi:MAG: hypothetical protein Q4G64_03195 [bacterium]|nr:hypothetical protein [bacterium]